MNDELQYKLLYAIIRKPQEGKTFVCIENIKINKDELHLVVTMNTIKSNLQFFSRLKDIFNKEQICIFNSKNKNKLNGYYHSKDVLDVKSKIIKKNVNIVVLCAHPTRFKQSIFSILEELCDSRSFDKSIIIHIDEAHSYVPPHRDNIIKINNNDYVKRIYLYSASPFNIWDKSSNSEIFKKIFIVDIEKDFKIKKSNNYFGVKDCEFICYNDSYNILDIEIPENIYKYNNTAKRFWYNSNYKFSIGNEQDFISFIYSSLKFIKDNNYINNNNFSYNFIPAYSRKLTHYAIMVYILEYFSNALVLIMNGDGTKQYIKQDNNIIETIVKHNNEPAQQILNVHKKYPNKPIFITGFTCIGMSVTLINEEIGNFDNVIFNHTQYINNPEILYQLCRFLFNYINWINKDNIKKTKLFYKSKEVIKICLDYENQINIIETDMCDSIREQDEIIGNIKVKEQKKPTEKIFSQLEKYCNISYSKISVIISDDNIDEENNKLNELKCIYKHFMGKDLNMNSKSMPKKNNDGFYECSTLSTSKVQTTDIFEKIKKWNKTSNFALNSLKNNNYKFCRIYVAYDNINDKYDYTWFIRKLTIQNNDEVNNIIKSIFNK